MSIIRAKGSVASVKTGLFWIATKEIAKSRIRELIVRVLVKVFVEDASKATF